MPLIPDRWRDYTPFHNLLEVDGVRMIAVKTPLCEVYNKPSQFTNPTVDDLLGEHEQFTPQMLVDGVKEKLGANITSVIDLTFTNRYYSRDHLPKGIFHFKLKCPGRETPDSRICRMFNSQLRKCFVKNAGGCVAIHCTHGVNRTGYLMCQYLMKYHGLSPDEAVTAFTDSRGHQIDRVEYVKALHDNAVALVSTCYPEDDAAASHPIQHGHFNDRYQPVALQHERYSDQRQRHGGGSSTASSRDNSSSKWQGIGSASQRHKDHPTSWSSYSDAATTGYYSQQYQKYGADRQQHSSSSQRSHHSRGHEYREDRRSHQPYDRPPSDQRSPGSHRYYHDRHDHHHSSHNQPQRRHHRISSSSSHAAGSSRDQQQHYRDDFNPPWRDSSSSSSSSNNSSSHQQYPSYHSQGPYGSRRN